MQKLNKKQKKLLRMFKQFERNKFVQTFTEEIKSIKKIFEFFNLYYIQVHCFQFIKNNKEYYNFLQMSKRQALKLLEKVEKLPNTEYLQPNQKVLVEDTISVLKEYIQREEYYTMIYIYMAQTFDKDDAFLLLDYL